MSGASLSLAGPPGPAGPVGPQGPQGPAGPAGSGNYTTPLPATRTFNRNGNQITLTGAEQASGLLVWDGNNNTSLATIAPPAYGEGFVLQIVNISTSRRLRLETDQGSPVAGRFLIDNDHNIQWGHGMRIMYIAGRWRLLGRD